MWPRVMMQRLGLLQNVPGSNFSSRPDYLIAVFLSLCNSKLEHFLKLGCDVFLKHPFYSLLTNYSKRLIFCSKQLKYVV